MSFGSLAAPSARRDPATGAVTLDPLTLGVAAALAGGSAGPLTATVQDRLAALVRAGLAEPSACDGAPPVLEPGFGALAALVATAAVTARVQRFVGPAAASATVLVTAERALVVEHDPGGTCTLVGHEPAALPAAVGAFLGADTVTPTRIAPTRLAPTRLALAPVVLERFHARLVAGDGPAAAAVLHTDGVGREELTLLLDLVRGRCRSWRIAGGGATVAVVEGAERGRWWSGTGPDGHHEPAFVPAGPGQLEAMLAGILLPCSRATHAA